MFISILFYKPLDYPLSYILDIRSPVNHLPKIYFDLLMY